MHQLRLVVVAERGQLAEPTVTGALADPGGTGGGALLSIEAAKLVHNMLKFELLAILSYLGLLRNQQKLRKLYRTGYSRDSLFG